MVKSIDDLEADPHARIDGRRWRLKLGTSEVDQLRETGAVRTEASNGRSVLLRVSDVQQKEPRTAWFAENARDEPVITLPHFPVGVVLIYEQSWQLNGYLRGELLNSIPLTPQEEATIEMFEWDRGRRSEDLSREWTTERERETQVSEKATSEALRDLARTEAWMLTSAGVNVLGVSANIAGEFGNKVNEQNRQTAQQISEASEKAAARVRDQRQMKVSEAREWGFEQRTTRKLKNPNLGHSLNALFFEVVGHYTIQTRVVPERARLVVLIENPISVRLHDPATVLAWEGVLRRSLRDPTLEPGFDSIRWLAAATIHQSDVDRQSVAAAPSADIVAWAQAGDLIKRAIDALTSASHYVASAWDGFRDQHGRDPTQSEIADAIEAYHRWLFRRFALEPLRPEFWACCTRFSDTWADDKSLLHLRQFLLEVRSFLGVVAESTLLLILAPQASIGVTVGVGAELGIKTLWYAQWFGFDDAGLGPQIESARRIVTQFDASPPQAEHKTEDSEAPPPADPYPLDKRADHVIRSQALYAHLSAHSDAYRNAIWEALAPGDQRRMLSAVLGRMADQVELEVVGYHEDRLALPVRLDAYPQLQDRVARMRASLDANAIERKAMLPVKGLLVESRLGRCEALEPFLVRHRDLDLEEQRAKVLLAVAEANQQVAELDRRRTLLEQENFDNPDAVEAPLLHVRIVEPDA